MIVNFSSQYLTSQDLIAKIFTDLKQIFISYHFAFVDIGPEKEENQLKWKNNNPLKLQITQKYL
jgi:hypothetical protein